MDDSYQTIAGPSEGFYREKGSRFLAFAYPVKDEEQVSGILSNIKKQYYDARHHCYAYLVGLIEPKWRASDDGEPRHSAGDPILNQIRSFDITNTLVIVVRYFGGTKLGKSGLINAYKTASYDALSGAEIIRKWKESCVRLHFEYEGLNEVMRMISEKNLNMAGQEYGDDCTVDITMRESESDEIMELFRNIDKVKEVFRLPG